MSESRAAFRGVYPIGDTDTNALPVKDVSSAVGYYTQVLGFALEERAVPRVLLQGTARRLLLLRAAGLIHCAG